MARVYGHSPAGQPAGTAGADGSGHASGGGVRSDVGVGGEAGSESVTSAATQGVSDEVTRAVKQVVTEAVKEAMKNQVTNGVMKRVADAVTQAVTGVVKRAEMKQVGKSVMQGVTGFVTKGVTGGAGRGARGIDDWRLAVHDLRTGKTRSWGEVRRRDAGPASARRGEHRPIAMWPRELHASRPNEKGGALQCAPPGVGLNCQTTPWSSIASATFTNPAMLAPST